MKERLAPPPHGRERLHDALRRLSADQLDHRIEVNAQDPDADLAGAVNRMAERLQQRRDEVVRAVELYCLRRFGAVLVHDLKNLAARLSFVPANLRAGDADHETVDACAATVEDTVQRLQSLVRRFRDQREAMVLKRPGDLNRAVRDAVGLSGVAEAPGIRLEVDLAALPPAIIDFPYLEEAIVNVLRNAVEAMPTGGTVRVVSRLHREEAGRALAEIAVADDGPGMSPQFVERELFAPFRSTKPSGLGLGMFSCRETVELHGGRVEVDSSPGSGTTFRLLLPVELPPEAIR